jgi:TRAP-type C4-dicarboxylate transport system permease small subunit
MKTKLIIEEYVMAALLGIMLLLGGSNVILRYVFNASIPYVEDMLIPMFVWLSLFGAPSACYRGANMGLSLFTDMMPAIGQKICLFLGSIAGVALFSYVFYNGTAMLLTQYRVKQVTLIPGVPAWVMSLCFPVCSTCYIVRCVQYTIRRYKEINAQEPKNKIKGGGTHG